MKSAQLSTVSNALLRSTKQAYMYLVDLNALSIVVFKGENIITGTTLFTKAYLFWANDMIIFKINI